MQSFNIVLFGSGKGSLIESICNASEVGILQVNIKKIFCNNFNSDIQIIGSKYNICVQEFPWDKSVMDRSDFDSIILDNIPEDINLLVFAGWDHIVTEKFIAASPRIINIHPSLPNEFIGLNCIKKAYDAFQQGKINYTGSMVHNVTKDLDRGEVINSVFVPILPTDTYDDLETRQKNLEKGLLISSIYSIANEARKNICLKKDVYVGKVRTVENIGYGLLLMTASDRLSSFDKHMCDIHNKGTVLNKMSSWWFHETKHIIDNHFLYSNGKYMIVKKTEPIKLEFVVRGYMTGSTNTSIWPMYKNGERNMYGIQFREGYVKNEKLDEIILTPTTKGVSDKPITEEEIISENYLTKEEFDFIKEKSFELFSFGQKKAQERGLILVDTKYEFGKLDDKIILIDELHTCDSSRYWLQDSYEECINSGCEPLKKDKDVIRDWVKKQCDPYKDEIPVIPFDLIEKVSAVYDEYIHLFKDYTENICFYEKNSIIDYYLQEKINEFVVIISGSESDLEHNELIQAKLKARNIYSKIYVCSAHKNTSGVLDIIQKYESHKEKKICYVTVAGMSNALSGVVSCNSKYPVIACPPFKDLQDMSVNISSTIQCPSNVPVMTILSPTNVALAIEKIFKL